MWAGYLALLNQQLIANHNRPIGFISPLIYPISAHSGYAGAFHDITSGSDGYSATAGYDLVTGWGSPNGAGLISALCPTTNFIIAAWPMSVSIAPGSSGNSTITITTCSLFYGPSYLSASGQPTGVTVGFTGGVDPSPGPYTSTMMIKVGSLVAAGTYTITVTGTGAGGTQTTTVTLTVT
jgi:hypothetical protein